MSSEPYASRCQLSTLTSSPAEARFISAAGRIKSALALLAHAGTGDLHAFREALDAEVRAEKEKDRIFWEPLEREMESFRRTEQEIPQHRA